MKLNKKKIDLLRAKNCMSTTKLSNVSGVSQTTIRKGYKENISIVAVGKIATALGVSVEEIIIEED